MTRKILAKLLEETTEVRGKDQRTVLENVFFLGCVEDRMYIAKKGIGQFGGGDGIDRRIV
jgi:hypothetical protein